jgi:threonine dehydratase
VASWYASRIKVVGVETTTCNTLQAGHAAGSAVTSTPSGLAADSLGASSAGALVFPIAQRYGSEVVLVDDEDIRKTQRHLWNLLRLLTEPGGAAAFAALLSSAYKPQANKRLGVLVCSATTPLDGFNRLLDTV